MREIEPRQTERYGEIWKETGRKRIGETLPYQNGRRTKLTDFIEIENKEGTKIEVHPSRIIWNGQEKKKPKREHVSKREKRNRRKDEKILHH